MLGLSVATLGVVQESAGGLFGKKKPSFKNEDFYTHGEFDVEQGKDAIVQQCGIPTRV